MARPSTAAVLLLALTAAACAAVDHRLAAEAGNLKPFLDAAPFSPARGPPPNDTVWTDVLALGVHGKAWPNTALNSPYQRLPGKAEALLCDSQVPCYPNLSGDEAGNKACLAALCAVWGLSTTPTGLYVQFSTASPTLYVRFATEAENGDWLWAFNGHSGVDVYAQAAGGPWRWASSTGNNPGSAHGGMSQDALAQAGDKVKNFSMVVGPMAAAGERNFTLYLPARGVLASVEVGVPAGESAPVALEPRSERPVVVYGTSILHGAAAGRAGMGWSTQMGRVIDKPVVNLGFSGHGLMQPQVGALIGETNASVYVLDCEWNMVRYLHDPLNYTVLENVTYHFLKQLRGLRPQTPVLLIEGHDHTPDWITTQRSAHQNGTRNGYRAAFNRVVAEGDAGVYYLNGSLKLGGPIATDFEAQAGPIAGVHVSNFAFRHFAE